MNSLALSKNCPLANLIFEITQDRLRTEFEIILHWHHDIRMTIFFS
ncbi:hypothetical protein X961_5658 [Burkholderia pseudomallei MSHR5613]|nr:hypothetical protein X961_5658 [Burkholderia pseudomallei MSHR5613]